ncbi:glycerophosphodiester phosphodiesterase [Jiella endophytica]|uniref:glycerophosphodiester phosphodiesterase n=2 Tax=Jiella endophytica TaxID=2558362 RepID=A0A4Y8RBL9_9HYPH|nr:glycerophosphodiester phosphodiesterase family protein [Jiella endophytica]TFF19128.1 glycerophosphodiester phosphodiesterase [Jiella endophytica]
MPMIRRAILLFAAIAADSGAALAETAAKSPVTAAAAMAEASVGVRPLALVDGLEDGPLKDRLSACIGKPTKPTEWSIGHRGAPLQFPEHSRQSYLAAARQGAGIIECDVAFTSDRELVCRHSQCDLHTTTDILTRPDLAAKCSQPFAPADPASGRAASAKCCTSDLTLAEFMTLKAKMDSSDKTATTPEAYQGGNPTWRTTLYAPGEVMSHKGYIALIKSLGRKFTPELKTPEVAMPFGGDYSQEAYASQMIEDYKAAGIPASDVFAQSFRLDDVKFWIAHYPDFGSQAVYLDDRDETLPGFDPMQPESFEPTMAELADAGVKIIAPPLWMLVTGKDGAIVPSPYAKAAKKAGLKIITWSLERSGPLSGGGGWYYQSIADVVHSDADMLRLLDTLANDIGVVGVFSDWPATTTFFANCLGLDGLGTASAGN